MSLATKYRPANFYEVLGQNNIVTSLQNEIKNKNIKHSYLFVGKSGGGKAQPLYSKIVTPNGYKQMKDIKLGDEIFGEDGNIYNVLGIYPQGIKDIYEITFTDGAKCRCSDEHLWNVSASYGKYKTMTLKEIMNNKLYTTHKDKDTNYKSWKYRIPKYKPLQFRNKDVPINPWLFGMLIGDGCFNIESIGLSLYEKDLYDKVQNILIHDNFELRYLSKNHQEIKDFRIADLIVSKDTTKASRKNGKYNHRFLQYIYDLGLQAKHSNEKFIPDIYKYNSIDIRIGVLQGLIDSDGYISNNSHSIEYSTSSKQLAEDIKFLVYSLGGTCSCGEHKAFYTYKEEKKQGLNSFELYIKMPDDIIPFTSKKHYSNYRKKGLTTPVRKIKDIKYIGKEQCQCIYTSNPSHLYLTDDCIVTHNTTLSRILAKQLNAYVTEIDAASNNSADKIRDILTSLSSTKSINADNNVLILDECHVLSTTAYQVLLKTLEEPPKHLYIILCTTEENKVPETIKNRCEVFHFQNIPVDTIISRLKYICDKEQYEYDDTSLEYLAKYSNGSMRNAISCLEQTISFANNAKYENVKALFNISQYDDMLNLIYAVCDNDYNSIIEYIAKVTDIDKYVQDLFSFVLDICIYIKSKDKSLMLYTPSIYTDEFDKLTNADKKTIEELRKSLYDLQFEGQHNPILKQLLIALIFNLKK